MTKHLPLSRVALLLVSTIICLQSFSQLPAFPGAEGFGKYATGGRYGTVYHVTNLNNSGTGSLRDALSAPNRIVVFDVAGVIRISERMIVSANIYIAGQTAPGEGITVYGNGWSFTKSNNTIARYLKIRMGIVGSSGGDANGLSDGHDIIFDHCSVSWGRDENFSINSTTAQNITIQNSIISQGLVTHSAGGLIQCDGGVTLYRNLYADNGTRNNKVKGVSQYVNNLVYNWSAGAYIMGGESSGSSYVNVTNNCFIQGPVDGVRPLSAGNSTFHIYATDNIYDNNRDATFNPYVIPQSEYEGPPDFQATPYNYPVLPTVPANTLIENLLPTVGASLPYRDYADYYVVNEVRSFGKKGELIANENTLPFGAPSSWNLWAGTARTDSDGDGMPDSWESSNGTNPSANDAMIIAANGYANIENYINGITAASSQDYLRTPLKLKTDSATQNTLYLSWLDYSEKEQGFIVERKINQVWEQIGSTGVNQNFFAVTGMSPEEADTFRVKAFNASMQSGYSNELIAKTKPVEVPVLDPAAFTPDLTWTGNVTNDWDKITNNWSTTGNPAAFTDSSSLLFPEAGVAGKIVNITAQMGASDILVSSNGNYSFAGPGYVAGSKSLNKTGSGTLSLLNNNTYTGATVLRSGTIELNKLANGGQASSIGASPAYGFNWVWKGGKWVYTGSTVTTDRNAVLDATTEFNVSNAATNVTFSGILTGDGGLVKSGPGKLILKSANPYAGETIINGGTLEVSPVSSATDAENTIINGAGIGVSNVLRLHNGTYKTSNGSNTTYEEYPMQLYVDDSTVNGFEPYRLANLSMTVHGNGTLNYTIPYLRELVQGDWSDFTGTLVAKGINTEETYSLLAIDNGIGFPGNRIVTTGNTKIVAYSNNKTLYLGGLSGNAGTLLSTGGTKTASFGNGFTTYVVGAAGTDETFNGVINNHLFGNAADGNGTTTIVKEGTGLWRLTGNNTYIGTTTITGGKLIVNGTNAGQGKVTVNDGTILAGRGSIAGEVDVAGNLEPGDSSVNTLTLKDKLTLQSTAITSVDINKTTNTWDKINVTSNIAYNGTLQINFTGTPAAGDKYKIFTTAAVVSGTITSFDPAVPGPGLTWNFKPATGELSVQTPNFVEAPTGLTLNATTSIPTATSSINCSWTDNSDNEDFFVLERSTDGVNFVVIAQPPMNATIYLDANLIPDTKYYYRIKAQSPLNESIYSTVVSVTTPSSTTLPTVPGSPSPANNTANLFLNGNTVNLTWSSNYAETYSIYFGTNSSSLVKLADIPATPATFTSPNIDPNTKYYWRIDATNANGTTQGVTWNFKTANVPVTVSGDYRTVASGNWGAGTVTTAVWEVFDGTSWNATAILPSGSTPTVTIRTGHTIRLNGTTSANNLVVQSGGVLISGTSNGAAGTATQRNLRVSSSINNFGTVGSSSTSTDRINFEGTRANGTIYITGTSTYYLNTFSIHSIAQTLEVVVDANLNLSSFLRAFSTTSPADNTQNDDNVTVTISEGKTVAMGSAGYLHIQSSGSTNASNTISSFGNYTYNINGTLDMRSTGTTAIVAHSTLPSVVTVNTNGSWLLGNAMRVVTAATTYPVGSLNLNIGPGGVVDAAARGVASTPTNLVVTNAAINLTEFFNITGSGVLRNRVINADMIYPVGSGNTYSPVKLNNAGPADLVSVGVITGFDYPVENPSRMVNKQFTVLPSEAATNLAISLGWVSTDQGAGFNPAIGVAQARYAANGWIETASALSGAGTAANPYYARTAGQTQFGSFVVRTPAIAPVVLTRNITLNLGVSGNATITTTDIDNGSSDDYAIAGMGLSKTDFDCSNVGNNTVTLTVTDIHGNTATGTANVLVKDISAPTVVTKNITVTLSGGTAMITADDVNNGTADACGISSLSLDKTTFNCTEIGTNEVTLTAVDVNGNSSTATAIITVLGIVPQPSIAVSRTDQTYTGGTATDVFLGYGAQALNFSASDATSALSQFYWSPSTSLSATSSALTVFSPVSGGSFTFTVVATNEYGCSASAAVTSAVTDVRCGTKMKKVQVCHKGTGNQCLGLEEVALHLSHGDKLGTCSTNLISGATQELETDNTTATLEIAPNPVSGSTVFSFRLAEAGQYQLELFNVNGVKIRRIQEAISVKGQNITYPFDASGLRPGIYLLRLTANNTVVSKKLIVQ
jgi:autotransporter-associated beta strand protein